MQKHKTAYIKAISKLNWDMLNLAYVGEMSGFNADSKPVVHSETVEKVQKWRFWQFRM